MTLSDAAVRDLMRSVRSGVNDAVANLSSVVNLADEVIKLANMDADNRAPSAPVQSAPVQSAPVQSAPVAPVQSAPVQSAPVAPVQSAPVATGAPMARPNVTPSIVATWDGSALVLRVENANGMTLKAGKTNTGREYSFYEIMSTWQGRNYARLDLGNGLSFSGSITYNPTAK
jgi:hypothetical protein